MRAIRLDIISSLHLVSVIGQTLKYARSIFKFSKKNINTIYVNEISKKRFFRPVHIDIRTATSKSLGYRRPGLHCASPTGKSDTIHMSTDRCSKPMFKC